MGWKKFGIGLGKMALSASIQQAGMQGLIPRQQPVTKRGLCKKMAQMLADEHQLPKSIRNEVFQGLLAYVNSIEDMLEAQSDSEFMDDWGDEEEEPGVTEEALSEPDFSKLSKLA